MLAFVRTSIHPRLVKKYSQAFGAVAHGHHDAYQQIALFLSHPTRPHTEYNTITEFLDHEHLTTYFQVGPGYMKYPGVDYGGHHHHEAYDWRKDPLVNKDIEENVMGTANSIINFKNEDKHTLHNILFPLKEEMNG
jgi:hypothetical protein